MFQRTRQCTKVGLCYGRSFPAPAITARVKMIVTTDHIAKAGQDPHPFTQFSGFLSTGAVSPSGAGFRPEYNEFGQENTAGKSRLGISFGELSSG